MSTLPNSMQAIAIENPGPQGKLVLGKHPVPTANAGELLIRVAYAALNRADLMQKQGNYPPPADASPLPGLEVSGEIVALGEGVTGWEVGQQVCALVNGGGYAEYAAAPAGQCFALPASLSQKDAAGLPEAMATIWMAVYDEARLQPGETVLMHGGASGIGTIGIQMLRETGNTVWVTASSAEKCAACEKLGAKAINYKNQDFVELLKSEIGGVEVVLDAIGGDYMQRNLSVLKPGGRLVSIAFLRGPKAELSMGGLLLKNLRWSGVTLRGRSTGQKAEYFRQLQKHFGDAVEKGRIRPLIHASFPLAEAEKAQEMMHQNLNIGKILLQVGAD